MPPPTHTHIHTPMMTFTPLLFALTEANGDRQAKDRQNTEEKGTAVGSRKHFSLTVEGEGGAASVAHPA